MRGTIKMALYIKHIPVTHRYMYILRIEMHLINLAELSFNGMQEVVVYKLTQSVGGILQPTGRVAQLAHSFL